MFWDKPPVVTPTCIPAPKILPPKRLIFRDGIGLIFVVLILTTLLSLFLLSLTLTLRSRLSPQKSHSPSYLLTHSPSTKRTIFTAHGVLIRGWPAAGGLIWKIVDGVELNYLSMSRFAESDRDQDEEKEDAFCLRLLTLGARYVGSEEHAGTEVEGLEIGFPSSGGGAWILDRAGDAKGRLGLAFTMDERCSILREMGARFLDHEEYCEEMKGRIEGVRW